MSPSQILKIRVSLSVVGVLVLVRVVLSLGGCDWRSHRTPTPTNPQNQKDYAAHLPNRELTPGDVFPVTAAEVCVPGYSKSVRNVPYSLKKQIYEEYGIYHHQKGEYEVDHLISLELGGSNAARNLWPEPYFGELNAHDKDKLENKLHQMVCNRQISLSQAQKEISTDWIAAYHRYVQPD